MLYALIRMIYRYLFEGNMEHLVVRFLGEVPEPLCLGVDLSLGLDGKPHRLLYPI